MNLQVRHCSERRARKLKIGELTVHGLNFTKKNLKRKKIVVKSRFEKKNTILSKIL